MKKNVFITGGATGIGNACVEKFYREGWNVFFMDINREQGEKVTELSPDIRFYCGDIKNKQDIANAVEEAAAQMGHFDCIVANAGIHRCNSVFDITDEELDLMINTNIKGTVNTIRLAVPHLAKGEKAGNIVINASDQCYVGKPNSFGYGLTKGALGQITKSLAIDLGERNIRVNAVCAGTIKTPLTENLFQSFADITHNGDANAYWKSEAELYPLKRVGTASEVAELVYFLASDKASFITGGLYLIDGGLTAK